MKKSFIIAVLFSMTVAVANAQEALKKVYNALKYGWPAVEVDPAIARDAVKPIERMLSLS